MFRRYQWASLIVESELPLPELPEARSAEGARVRFHLATSRRPDESSGLRDDSAPAPPWLSIERDGDGHVMRFRDLAEFHLSADRGTIRCTAAPQLGLETVRHLLLDQVLPASLSGGPVLGLHASAVVIDGAAVAFAGAGGRGKSTLSASFVRAGFRLLTDDCLVMRLDGDQVVALPSYPSVRVWSDSAAFVGARPERLRQVAGYSSKLRLDLESLSFAAPAPVRHVYILQRAAAGLDVRIEPIARREAYIELLRHAFQLDPFDAAILRRHGDQLETLARTVAVSRLHVPWEFPAVTAVQQAVVAAARTVRGR